MPSKAAVSTCTYLLMSALSAVSTYCCQHRLLSVPAAVSTSCCQHLLLSAPAAVSTCCCQHSLLSAPAAVSIGCCLYLLLSARLSKCCEQVKHCKQRSCKIYQERGKHFALNLSCFVINPFYVAILRFLFDKNVLLCCF